MIVCGQNFFDSLPNRLFETIRQAPKTFSQDSSRRLCDWLDWSCPHRRLKKMSTCCALLLLQRGALHRLPRPRCGSSTWMSLTQPPTLLRSPTAVCVVQLLVVLRLGRSALWFGQTRRDKCSPSLTTLMARHHGTLLESTLRDYD